MKDGWKSELKVAWQEVWGNFKLNLKERGLFVLLAYLAFVGATWPLIFPNDRKWLDIIRADGGERFSQIEDFLSIAGDFLWFNIIWTVGFLLWAGLKKRKEWYRIALVFLIGGTLSGVTSRAIKMTAGRARPSMTDKSELTYRSFIGPNKKAKTHGYPSGHAAGSMGSAAAIMMYAPKVGWPSLCFASAVTVSRMYGNHHFPMDSLHGAAMGIASGYLAARRPRKKKTK